MRIKEMISKIWIAKQILPISILGNVLRMYGECAYQCSHLKRQLKKNATLEDALCSQP